MAAALGQGLGRLRAECPPECSRLAVVDDLPRASLRTTVGRSERVRPHPQGPPGALAGRLGVCVSLSLSLSLLVLRVTRKLI